MAKTQRLSLRLTESEYRFVDQIAIEFGCSHNEAVNKVITVAQIVYKSEFNEILKLLLAGYDIGVLTEEMKSATGASG